MFHCNTSAIICYIVQKYVVVDKSLLRFIDFDSRTSHFSSIANKSVVRNIGLWSFHSPNSIIVSSISIKKIIWSLEIASNIDTSAIVSLVIVKPIAFDQRWTIHQIDGHPFTILASHLLKSIILYHHLFHVWCIHSSSNISLIVLTIVVIVAVIKQSKIYTMVWWYFLKCVLWYINYIGESVVFYLKWATK